jgi:hypothetical protein
MSLHLLSFAETSSTLSHLKEHRILQAVAKVLRCMLAACDLVGSPAVDRAATWWTLLLAGTLGGPASLRELSITPHSHIALIDIR